MPKSRTRKKKPSVRRHPIWLLIPAILLAVGLSDCPKKAPPRKEGGKEAAPQVEPGPDPAVADIPLDPGRGQDPDRVPGKPRPSRQGAWLPATS